MAWQDVQGWYVEQDDAPDPPPVELVTEPCPGCGTPYTFPADECDPCCSPACSDKVHAERTAAANAALAAWWERERATMREFRCVVCGHPYTDYPTTDGTCGRRCGEEQAARLYADTPHVDVDF